MTLELKIGNNIQAKPEHGQKFLDTDDLTISVIDDIDRTVSVIHENGNKFYIDVESKKVTAVYVISYENILSTQERPKIVKTENFKVDLVDGAISVRFMPENAKFNTSNKVVFPPLCKQPVIEGVIEVGDLVRIKYGYMKDHVGEVLHISKPVSGFKEFYVVEHDQGLLDFPYTAPDFENIDERKAFSLHKDLVEKVKDADKPKPQEESVSNKPEQFKVGDTAIVMTTERGGIIRTGDEGRILYVTESGNTVIFSHSSGVADFPYTAPKFKNENRDLGVSVPARILRKTNGPTIVENVEKNFKAGDKVVIEMLPTTNQESLRDSGMKNFFKDGDVATVLEVSRIGDDLVLLEHEEGLVRVRDYKVLGRGFWCPAKNLKKFAETTGNIRHVRVLAGKGGIPKGYVGIGISTLRGPGRCMFVIHRFGTSEMSYGGKRYNGEFVELEDLRGTTDRKSIDAIRVGKNVSRRVKSGSEWTYGGAVLEINTSWQSVLVETPDGTTSKMINGERAMGTWLSIFDVKNSAI